MKSKILTPMMAGLLCGLGLACSGESPDTYTFDSELEVGESFSAVAACEGDDLQYDFNAFAASLAVAAANELGRWDAATDFEVRNGKLELSSIGSSRCSSGCLNITALLRLQDDASSGVPYHSPSVYRGKLTNWYQRQKSELTALVDDMLTVEQGVYRFKSRASGQYMQVDNGATYDGAPIEQRWSAPQWQADHWRVVLDHTAHKLINVRSGKCLALAWDSSAENVPLVQQTCSSNPLQRFGFATIGETHYAVRTKTGQALRVKDSSMSEDTPIVQSRWDGTYYSEQWALEPTGGSTIAPDSVATAMYSITARHSGKAIGVDNGSISDGALIEQHNYSESDMRFHWYVTRITAKMHNFVNRQSGKCLDLQSNDAWSRLVQRTCSGSSTQLFMFNSTGGGEHVIYTVHGRPLEVENSSQNTDAPVKQGGDVQWLSNRLMVMKPLLAGEPHRLTFSHKTTDGPCGDYYWYDIKQPNGQGLRSPADSFVQLIFAGGKTRLDGRDENPFIAQQVSGNLVAIDPSGYMNAGGSSTSGSCIASDILFDASQRAAGRCCIRYNGASGTFRRSSWSSTTFLCQ